MMGFYPARVAILALLIISPGFSTVSASANEISAGYQGESLMVTSDVSGSHTSTPGVPAFGLDHDGVGLMRITFTGGTIRCSGSLLTQGGRTWAITAAHCANGAISATMEFDTPSGNFMSTTSTPGQITVHPSYNGDTFSGYDVALIELDAPADLSIPSYELNRSVDEIGKQVVMVGYGNTGHGSTGQIGGTAGTKRVGLNRIEHHGVGGLTGGAGIINNHTMLTWDYDSGLAANDAFNLNYGFTPDLGFGADEVGLAPGDSGGPSFIDDGGTLKIAGIHSHGFLIGGHQGDYGGSLNFGWGELQGDARINEASILSWIDSLAVDYLSNASFSSSSDVNSLNLNFGTLNAGAAVAPVPIDITNLAGGPGITAALDLLSVTGSGDTNALTTDVAPFASLAGGSTNNFQATIDSGILGDFNASYDLEFTDSKGTNQTLTVTMSGTVENVDNGDRPDLVYNALTGELWMDPDDSGSLMLYDLKSDYQFIDANHTPVLGGVVTTQANNLSEASFSALSSAANIGAVLASGLTLSEFSALMTTEDVVVSLGSAAVAFDLDIMCGTGDADCDGDVDIGGDIFNAFSNFTGPGTFQMVRAQGDVEGHAAGYGDDDVDVSDLLAMFGNFTGPLDEGNLGLLAPSEAADPSIPDLIYDPATGEVALDPDGAGIIGYVLKNGSGAFLAGGHTTILGGVSTSLPGELSEAAFSSPAGPMSIGFVLPAGLDLAMLTALLSTNEVSASLGAPVVPFDLVVLSGPAVPEPSAIIGAAFGLIGLGLLAARKRREIA